VKAATKRAIVLEVAERLWLSPLTRNFLALVAQRRRLDLLGEIIAAYRATVDEAAGRVRARVRSAAPMSGRRARGAAGAARAPARQDGPLGLGVDPGLLGGFVAEVGSRVLDMSIAGQLAALRERIIKGAGGAA
jgi:F-type H+-transporting ATPase subunit delta